MRADVRCSGGRWHAPAEFHDSAPYGATNPHHKGGPADSNNVHPVVCTSLRTEPPMGAPRLGVGERTAPDQSNTQHRRARQRMAHNGRQQHWQRAPAYTIPGLSWPNTRHTNAPNVDGLRANARNKGNATVSTGLQHSMAFANEQILTGPPGGGPATETWANRAHGEAGAAGGTLASFISRRLPRWIICKYGKRHTRGCPR